MHIRYFLTLTVVTIPSYISYRLHLRSYVGSAIRCWSWHFSQLYNNFSRAALCELFDFS